MNPEISYRAGVDIGGTFTDIVIADEAGTIHTKKVSSTPDDYGRAIVEGLTSLLDSVGARPSQVREVVHATTVATNTVLESKGARTALITTRGFRDVLEIARLRAPTLYNLNYTKPKALVQRRHRYEVDERMRSDGSIDVALDEGSVNCILQDLRSERIDAIAVCLLHSYANPMHEARIREILTAAFGEAVYVTCSHEILPEIREYERTSTTVVNAYLGPVVVGYLRSLIGKLRAVGVMAPVSIMHSNGGVMTAEAVMQKPACIIESGPAAGVIAGAFVASASGYSDIITVDMGGTTAKAAIVEAGQPARTTEYEVGAGINLSSKLVKGGGHAVKLPFIDVSEIGAGGGSKVRLDAGGLIRVGPDSAGSVPGPVCYDAGGEVPTLSDALVCLGYLNPHYLAGGDLRINGRKAALALETHIAKPAGLDLLEAAYGILSIAAATMTRAVKAVSVYRGRDPRDFAMFAFGGNGPVIAHAIAELVEMKTVIVPPSPGVFSALGLLFSETRHEFMRSLFRRLDRLAAAELSAALADLSAQASTMLAVEGHDPTDFRLLYSLDLRYAEQAFELTVPLDASSMAGLDLTQVVKAFHAEHFKTYGHASTTDPIELVNVRVTGTLANVRSARYDGSQASHGMAPAGMPANRQAYFGKAHGLIDTPVIQRRDLSESPIHGPVIVEEYDATCVVPPGAQVSIDSHHNILISMPGAV